MNRDDLIDTLSKGIPKPLATDLVDEFIILRRDVATNTLCRSSPGKIVETVTQILQHLDSGKCDEKPNVDEYLRTIESKGQNLNDGLRICASRIARSMYTLRNKRNIAHKGEVDPNTYDLKFLMQAAQWLVAELLRNVNNVTMEEAGRQIDRVQVPVGSVVEDFGNRKLVLPEMSVPEEILVLLHSHYPDTVPQKVIVSSLDRRNPRSVKNVIRILWQEKKIQGDSKQGYKLTQKGFIEGSEILTTHLIQGSQSHLEMRGNAGKSGNCGDRRDIPRF